MTNSIVGFIKRIIFTPAYVHLYPLAKKEGIVDKINHYDYNLNDDFAKDINSLYLFLLSDIESNKLDAEQSNRNLDETYKIKKIKHKDKETKIKTVEQVKVEKKRMIDKEDRLRYSKMIEEIENESSHTETLIDRLTSGQITEYDLSSLDSSLKRNRFKSTSYIGGIILTVGIVILLTFLLRFINI